MEYSTPSVLIYYKIIGGACVCASVTLLNTQSFMDFPSDGLNTHIHYQIGIFRGYYERCILPRRIYFGPVS